MAPSIQEGEVTMTTRSNITRGNHTGVNTTTESNGLVSDPHVQLMWALICAFFLVFGLSLATACYLWDRYLLPENVKKRKHRRIAHTKKKEEKAIAAIKKEPIQVDQFLQRLRQKKLDKYLTFEVRAIVRNQDEFPCTIALHPNNAMNNVCPDVISYDHSIVRLRPMSYSTNLTYINASFIDGYNEEKEYIATQGPKGKSVIAFWQMVWQQNVHCVVMATGLFENALQQCDKYWGDVLSHQKHVQQGDIHIHLQDKLELAKLVIRTFHIRKDGCDELRVVKHFEMGGFTDESTDPGFLLDVRRRVTRFMATSQGPILVHCRCGGGRTAVFITIDYCLKQLEAESFVDIYSTVLHLRKYRQNMVRSLTQYRLIYDTLALHVQVWNTVIRSSQLAITTHKLMLNNPHNNKQPFEKEYQILQDIVPKIAIGDCASGHRDENRNKSRDIMLLPPERARPYLQTMETNDSGTDFVNAVFVDGYYQNNNFICTQWPMQSTINDIWRLLHDSKVTSLVVLHENKCNRTFPCFWPKVLDEEMKYGPIGVKYLGCQKYPHIVIRAFAIRKKASGLPLIDLLTKGNQSMVVKMFHYTSWHQRDKVPTSTKSFLYMMGCVDEWQKKNNNNNPICVMSKDGYSKCGLYCTLNYCCDQLYSEQEVDILNTVRIVKKNRPCLIPTPAEYIYCYTYMTLVVNLMEDEHAPKIMVTSPSVISGEIQEGYETLTGFENILDPLQEENISDKSGQGTSLKNHHNHTSASTSYNMCDSRSLSYEDLHSVGNNSHYMSENGYRTTESRHKGASRGKHKHSAGHVKENGYLVDMETYKQGPSHHRRMVAPAAPGHIWSPEDEDNQSDHNATSPKYKMPKRQSTKRRPLHRQNAEELCDLNVSLEPPTYSHAHDIDSTYL